MKIRKTIQILAILAVLSLTAAPAQAVGTPSTGSTKLRARVEPSYTVVIPKSMDDQQSLKAGVNNIGEVKATALRLEPNTNLICTLQGDTLNLVNGQQSDTVPYNAYYNDTSNVKTTSLSLNTPVPVKVAVNQDDLDKAKAGTYTGSLNFVLEIK